jgi:putative hydrolase of the HAD superfamily
MKYEAVIFYLSGTLINNFSTKEHIKVLSDMASTLCVSKDPFIESWVQTFEMRSLGAFKTVEENIIYVCHNLNFHPNFKKIKTAVDIRFNYTKNSLKPKDGAIETLKSIKMLGRKLALVSDCSSEVFSIWNETPFAKLFDVSIFSCDVRIKKPDTKIYKLACDRLSILPNRRLYIGDGSSNELSGARSAGMFPVLIQDYVESDAHKIDEESWDGEKMLN